MNRISIKITGGQGQGVNSVGEMCAKGLKNAGYCVFGYREYMSIIKGGHSSYQLDVSSCSIESSETQVDILVCFNHVGLIENTKDVRDGGIILHQSTDWEWGKELQEDLTKRNITVLCTDGDAVLKKLKARLILGNMLFTSIVWGLLGREEEELQAMVEEQYGHKGEKILSKNYECIAEGYSFIKDQVLGARGEGSDIGINLPEPNENWKECLLLTGSHAMGIGLIHAGCRMYVGYPMTPSSPLLSYISSVQNETGMVIKQAEDEITAAQMMSGAMHMGTRAATGTSGGGFDLMSETVSMNAIIENPSVFVLAQRPGPGTGLPTWTAQADLLLAVGSAHGEFPRLVLSVSGSDDAFSLMEHAFNYAEEFQIPVIILTDKQIAEAIYTQKPYDQSSTIIKRGLVEDTDLASLKSTDRFDPTVKSGVSPRWLPGQEAATYCAQGDEHDSEGKVVEGAENAKQQLEKRMRKGVALKDTLPDPLVYSASNIEYRISNIEDLDIRHSTFDILIVGWGSNKGVILDALQDTQFDSIRDKIGYLHYEYLWPLKTELLEELAGTAKKVVLVECNAQGQLGMLIAMECGLRIEDRILKYDGRPFFVDELSERLISCIHDKGSDGTKGTNGTPLEP